MPASQGQHGFGTALFVNVFNSANPGSLAELVTDWTEITDVTQINGVDLKPSVTDITHLRSPGKAKEKVPGFIDPGQNTFTLNYSKSVMSLLLGLVPTASDAAPDWGRKAWALLLPDLGVWLYNGFLAGNPVKVGEDEEVSIDATIEISGLPEFLELS